MNCSALTRIDLPDSVTEIGDSAFAFCSNLTSVDLGTGLTQIGVWGFQQCTNLTDITFPDSLISIGDSAFIGSGLTNVVIPNSVTRIGIGAFAQCPSLTQAMVGSGLESIGLAAFDSMNLERVLFQGDAPDLVSGFVFPFFGPTTVYYLPGSSGWGESFGGRPVVVWNPMLHAQGAQVDGFHLEITGSPDIPIVIEASTDLPGSNWSELHSGTLTDGFLLLTDPDGAIHPARFYRVRWL